MSSGPRPIGAAKGKQSDTEALCHPPPPLDAPPPLEDWAQFSSGPLANHKFSLLPSAPIS